MRILFFILDLLAFILITFIVVTLRYGGCHTYLFLPTIKTLAPAFMLCSVILWVFSFYDFSLIKMQRLDYRNTIIAFAISLLGSAFGIYFGASIFNMATPKLILISVFIIYFSYIYFTRKAYASLTFYRQKILLLGKSDTLKLIEKTLRKSRAYKLLGRFETPQEAQKISPDNVDLIIMGSKMLQETENAWAVISTKFLNKGVLLTTDYNFHEELFKCSSKGSLKDNIWILRGVASRQQEHFYPVIKRAMDIIFCLILTPVLLPLGIVTYFMIKWVDGVSPFFFQERIGKNEQNIFIYKFRTMKPGTEEITKTGNILRRFRLDEIPQLINIFKGDISIVGPRPIWNDEYYFLNKYLPCHNIRSIIKPGLTGWAQLNFKAPPTYCVQENLKNMEHIPDSTFDAAKTRLCYDIWYIKNRSFFLDVEIMFKTAKRAFIKDKKFD